MAKKVVASLQKKDGKGITKCIKMVKSKDTGAYVFEEAILDNEHVKKFFGE